MGRNLRSELVMVWRFLTRRWPRRLEWDPKGVRSDGKKATTLVLYDELPRPPFRVPSQRLTVTTAPQRLLIRDFGDAAIAINDVGAKGHGRTLTCSRERAPLAAIAYHLPHDNSTPLLVTAIAVHADSALQSDSLAAVGILPCYLSRAAGSQHQSRPTRLGTVPPPSGVPLASQLGFVPTGAPSEYATGRQRYMEWSTP